MVKIFRHILTKSKVSRSTLLFLFMVAVLSYINIIIYGLAFVLIYSFSALCIFYIATITKKLLR